eukprot:gnl/MRDRNA2_/MRDRNA2_132743_c0_seq1.p1 gnl/MRDRNA2_/MRDRNA2_132743_c0~~gnl/MRDRNA2_/MRDRNA2_132743_c0_seq1.p1  ORF type:complete len:326 (+),score=74.90 gnl/MRDRNA2_/MRDRNA2_132743_c0_seq1:105-1082(+)
MQKSLIQCLCLISVEGSINTHILQRSFNSRICPGSLNRHSAFIRVGNLRRSFTAALCAGDGGPDVKFKPESSEWKLEQAADDWAQTGNAIVAGGGSGSTAQAAEKAGFLELARVARMGDLISAPQAERGVVAKNAKLAAEVTAAWSTEALNLMFTRMTAGEAGAEDLEGVAVAWTGAGNAWTTAAESLEAPAPGWTASTANAIAVATLATAEGASLSGFEEVAAAWRRTAAIWKSSAEYIDAQSKNPGLKDIDKPVKGEGILKLYDKLQKGKGEEDSSLAADALPNSLHIYLAILTSSGFAAFAYASLYFQQGTPVACIEPLLTA